VTASAAAPSLPQSKMLTVPSAHLQIEVLRRPVEFAQYTSREFAHFCKDKRVRTSVGRTGVCWDNAAAESFFAALKNEMYYRQTWPTRARARFAVAEYIEVFYNRRLLHSTLGYRTPLEALTDHRRAAAAT
jgi:putative transposase